MREIFIKKLTKGARSLRLPSQYTSLFCLSALDINQEIFKLAKQQLQRCVAFRRHLVEQCGGLSVEPANILPEYLLPYVIHLLAYDEEMSAPNAESRRRAEKCLWFILEPIVQKSNRFAFFMKLLNTIKSTREAVLDSVDSTERLHSICDLVGKILATKVHQISTEEYKDPILLPKHLYKQDSDAVLQTEDSTQFMEAAGALSPSSLAQHDMETEGVQPDQTSQEAFISADEESVGSPSPHAMQSEDPSSHHEGAMEADNACDSNESSTTCDASPSSESVHNTSGRKRKRNASQTPTDTISSGNSDAVQSVRKSQRLRK